MRCRGTNCFFVREDVVEAAWSIVDPILSNVVPLCTYNPGTWGPEEADRLATDVGGWRTPNPKSAWVGTSKQLFCRLQVPVETYLRGLTTRRS